MSFEAVLYPVLFLVALLVALGLYASAQVAHARTRRAVYMIGDGLLLGDRPFSLDCVSSNPSSMVWRCSGSHRGVPLNVNGPTPIDALADFAAQCERIDVVHVDQAPLHLEA